MKKWFVLFSLCLAVWSSFAQAGELERIQNKGVITVSLNREYPPFAMQKDGKPFGLDVDLAHLLAEYLGVKVRFIQPQSYDQQIPKLLAGESDIIIAAMTRTIASRSQPWSDFLMTEGGRIMLLTRSETVGETCRDRNPGRAKASARWRSPSLRPREDARS